MYLQFYGLHEEPFGSTPDPRFLFASAAHREALASLQYAIETGRGFFALIAPPGMGKTTLLYQTLEKYHAEASTAFLFNTQCTSHEFLRFLLTEVGIEAGTDDVVRMHSRFNDFLVDNSRRGRRFILIVDEAQNLSSEVLETVRLLSNLETPRAKLMQIVLAGQPELYATLKSPELAQLLQRVAMISRIKTLSAEETREYIQYRLAVAGHSGGALFSDEAMAMIADYSHGVPRIINSICFNALSLGYASEKAQVDVDLAMEAIADSPHAGGAPDQLAPAPLYSSRAMRHAFGSGESAGFRARARVVGMPSKPLVDRSADRPERIKTPLPKSAPPMPAPMPIQAPAPMIAKSPTAIPVAFNAAATAPSLVELSSGSAQPLVEIPPAGSPAGNEAELPRLSAQRGLSAVPASGSVPPASERPKPAPVKPDSQPSSALVFAAWNDVWTAAWGRVKGSSSKAAAALVVLICCVAALMYLAIRPGVGKPMSSWTAQSVNSALPASGSHADTAITANPALSTPASSAPALSTPAPAAPAPTMAPNQQPGDSPASAEATNAQLPASNVRLKAGPWAASAKAARAAVAPTPSDAAADLVDTPAPAAPAQTRKPRPSSEEDSDRGDTAVIVFPQAIQQVQPEYPFLASKMNEGGDVVLTANVNERGEPENLKFVEGNELFRQAALEAASRWKYRPGTYNGKPAGMPVKIHLRFSSRFASPEVKSSQDVMRKEGTE